MLRRTIMACAFMLLAVPAGAQQQQLAQTPLEQALAGKLLAELNAGLKCVADDIGLQQRFAASEARVRELEAKYEPKSDPKPAAPQN